MFRSCSRSGSMNKELCASGFGFSSSKQIDAASYSSGPGFANITRQILLFNPPRKKTHTTFCACVSYQERGKKWWNRKNCIITFFQICI
jgi:hypothetical protein